MLNTKIEKVKLTPAQMICDALDIDPGKLPEIDVSWWCGYTTAARNAGTITQYEMEWLTEVFNSFT